MGQSIGDLFVKLGFDVDDTKLKEFDSSIRSTFNSLLQIAGVSLTIAGLVKIGKDASDTAVQLRNLATDFGTSTRAAQGFASALHQFNPEVSREQGIGSYKRLEQYIQNIRTTGGSATAYNMLGGFLDENTTPEVMIATIMKNLPAIINKYGRTFASKWVNDLFGDVGALNALTRSPSDYQAAAEKGIVTPEQLERTVQMRENISELINQWDVFWGNIMGDIAPYITKPLKEINEKGFGGAIRSWTDTENARGRAAHILGWGSSKEQLDSYLAAHPELYGPAPTTAPTGNIISQIMGMGWSRAQAEGIARRLMRESSLNPSAVGDNGKAYGLAQWHPDRQGAFAAWAGHPIQGSSLAEQLGFMNFELTRGMEQKAGRHLRAAQTADNAYSTFTKDYERPSVNQTNTIVVHSNADAAEVAREVDRHIQDRFSYAYAQQNLGSDY